MKADVSAIIKVTGAAVKLDDFVELGEAVFLGETYRFLKPLKIVGEIYNNGQTLSLKANVTGSMHTECSRCLKDIEVDVDFDIDELLARIEEGEEPDEDIIPFEGYEVDIDSIVADSFRLNIMGSYLCDEDCKGLCPACGKDLNEGPCDCVYDYIDPRWQALADILKKQQEDDS